MHSGAALEAQRLTKRYSARRQPALDGIDVAIAPGSVVALVGPNGAGKSTLIRSFLGFERPSSGRVLVQGIDPQRDRTGALNRIGYVGQSAGVYRDLTAADHIALAASLRGGYDADGAVARLDDLGIGRGVPAGQLSGGQQAQLALTIALGTRAPVLLLDEPLASLDPLARRDFLAMLRTPGVAGSTILFASHIVGDLEAVCDRLLVLTPARVALDMPIAEARAVHALVSTDAAPADDPVGIFDDHAGRPWALIRTTSPADPSPSLDDIVLGYLAGARAGRVARGRSL